MAERNIHPDLKTSLINNDPFTYLHLVKFEKPKPTNEEGGAAKLATDYTYITDAPYNIVWDDGTETAAGAPTGPQTYVANKLLDVGSIQETTEARASNISIKLSSVALGTVVTLSGRVNSGHFEANVDLAEAGFREGDKVKLVSSSNAEVYVRFDRFTDNASGTENAWAYYTAIDATPVNDGSLISYTVSLASEELNALTLNKEATLYSNYINREVFIYKQHNDPVTGTVIGAPFLLFRGIIAQGSIQDKADGTSTITWGLSSHWGDFMRVQGRLTTDAAHRALDINGSSDVDALLRPEYLTDYGFMHSERSINVLGVFQVQELRYKSKRAGGLSGWLGGKKIVEYYETVDREVDLRFNLAAAYLPVVYGVQKVPSIPIFADIDKENPKDLYVIYALCEGEIGGIFDIHVDQQPSICVDSMDEAVRGSTATAESKENANVLCYGRADRGDVLAGANYVSGVRPEIPFIDITDAFYDNALRGRALAGRVGRFGAFGTQYNATGGQGLTHEATYTFEKPIDATFVVHTGKADQAADEVFVAMATNKLFKVQNDYYEGDPANYWSTSHQLLDTANVACKFTISEGEETIPEYEFVVKGKYVECYNYDQSFKHDPTAAGQDHNNFNIGDLVTVDSGGDPHTNVYIIDKWIMYDKNAQQDVRFRWATNWPAGGDTLVNLNGSTSVTMTKGADTWSMITSSFANNSGNVTTIPAVEATAASYTDVAGNGLLTLTLDNTDPNYGTVNTILNNAPTETVYLSINQAPESAFLVKSYSASVATLTPHTVAGAILEGQNYAGGNVKVMLSNAVNIGSLAGVTPVEDMINVTRIEDGVPITRAKSITAVVPTTTVVLTETPFAPSLIPNLIAETGAATGTADTFTTGPANDLRVTTNPAMQLLDYITNTKYGKGLDLYEDLNLETFLESARLCDDRSKIRVVCTSAPDLQGVYRYERGDFSLVFQGRVVEVTERVHSSGTFYEVTFDDCIGKLGYKLNNWRTYKAGDLVWGYDTVKTASAGTILTEAAFNALPTVNSFTMTKVGGGTVTVTTARLGGSKNTNSIVRAWTAGENQFSSPGYSLHDSDDVKYWKYTGWDEPEQRYVTRHQTNQLISTANPIFDNINSMLIQFNGIMRYSNGKYELDIKTAQPAAFTPGLTSLSEDDIIGDIKLDDKGQRNSFNSISANIVDPQNKFGSRAVSFFNSNYLKEDKGVPKQGNFSMPGVSNYFSARTNIVQFLDESRYGLTITLTVHPRAYTLLSGEVIVINYKRFSWVNKAFRIDTINLQPDGLVTLVCSEHNNAAYLIDYSDRSSVDQFGNLSNSNVIAPPESLQASTDLRGEIVLTWTNSAAYDTVKYEVEIYMAPAGRTLGGDLEESSPGVYTGNDFVNAAFLDHVDGDRYVHDGLGASYNVHYYWIRYAVPSIYTRGPIKYSVFTPLSTGPGVQGTAFSGASLDAITIILSNEAHTFPVNDLDVVVDYVGSGTDIWLYEGATLLNYEDVVGISPPGTWKITDIDDLNITVGAKTEQSGGLYVYVGEHSGMSPTGTAYITYHVEGTRVGGEAIDFYKTQSFSAALNGIDGDQGAAGLDSKAVHLTASTNVIIYDQNEVNPIPSVETGIVLTATAQNVATPWFKFTGQGITDEVVFSAPGGGDPPFSKTKPFVVPADYVDIDEPQTIRVDVSNGDQTPLAFDTMAIVAVHPGTDGQAGADGRSVALRAGTLIFTYDNAGLNPINPKVPQEVPGLGNEDMTVVTANPINASGTPYYEFFLDEVSVQGPSDQWWYDYTAQASSDDMPQTIEVEMREASAATTTAGSFVVSTMYIIVSLGDTDFTSINGVNTVGTIFTATGVGAGTGTAKVLTIKARDQISMSALKFGSDAITVILSNDAHAIPVTNEGSFDFTGTGTSIRVFEGAFELEYDAAPPSPGPLPGTWDIISITDINVIAALPAPFEGPTVNYAVVPPVTGWDPLSLDINGLPTEFVGTISYEIDGKRVDGRPFNLDKQQSFSLSIGGTDGANGNIYNLKLSSSDQVFKYDTVGNSVGVPSIVFTAERQGTNIQVYWETRVLKNGIWVVATPNTYFEEPGLPYPGLEATLTEIKFNQILAEHAPVDVQAVQVYAQIDLSQGGNPQGPFYIDTITIQKLQDGASTPVGQLTNPAHITPAESDGSGYSLGPETGGTFRVWDGLTEVTNTGLTNAGSFVIGTTYTVVSLGSTDFTLINGVNTVGTIFTADGIGAGTGTATTGPYYNVYQGADTFFQLTMSIDPTTGVYSLTGPWDPSSNAVAFTLQAQYKGTYIRQVYSIIKGKKGTAGANGAAGANAKAVSLQAGKQIFTYSSDGQLTPALDSTIITATDYSPILVSDPHFQFYLNDDAVGSNTPTPTYTYNAPPTSTDPQTMPAKIEVELRSGATMPGTVLARDQLGISALQIGSNAVSVILSNEAHTIPTDSAGAGGVYTGSGTTVQVFDGSNPLTYVTSGPIAGQWTFSNAPPLQNTSGVITPFAVPPGTIGGNGSTVASIGDHSAMTTDTAQITMTINGILFNGNAFSGITKAQSFSKSKAGIQGLIGANATNGITVVLGNAAHTLPATAGGVVTSYTNSGTTIQVFEGATALTYQEPGNPAELTAGKWSLTASAGGTIGVGSLATGDGTTIATVGQHGEPMGADTAKITYTISGKRASGDTFTSINVDQTFAKSKAGSTGNNSKSVSVTAASYVATYNAAGNLTSSPTISLTAYTQNFIDPFFRWTGGNTNDGVQYFADDITTYYDSPDGATNTRTVTIPNTAFTTPYNIVVSVSEAAASTVEVARDSFTIFPVREGAAGADAVFYYIKPTNGTAIKNGTGTLTVQARRVTGGTDTLLSTGTIQLYVVNTLVTSGNGYVAGSNGYTGIFDTGDITGDVVVLLKDGSGGTVLDSISLVDIDDGASTVSGFIEPSAPTAHTRASNQSTWTPAGNTVDLDVTFVQAGATVARDGWRITRDNATGLLTGAATIHPLGDLNPQRITVTEINEGTQAMSVKFTYSYLGDTAVVTQTVTTSLAGATGSQGSQGTFGSQGANAVSGSVSATWIAATQAINAGVWTPASTTSTVTVTFYQGGASIASGVWTVTRDNGTGNLTIAPTSGGAGITISSAGSGSASLTSIWTHTASNTKVAETFLTARSGSTGAQGSQGAAGGGGGSGFVLPPSLSLIASKNGAASDAGFSLLNTGVYQVKLNGPGSAYVNAGNWLIGGDPSLYEAQFAGGGGTLFAGAYNTWYPLGADRTWNIQDTTSAGGPATATGVINIRTIIGSVQQASMSLYLEAEYVNPN